MHHPPDVSYPVQHKLVLALREYRSLHLSQSRGSVPHNALIVPPALRLAPAWALGALRTAALRGSVREVRLALCTCACAIRSTAQSAMFACLWATAAHVLGSAGRVEVLRPLSPHAQCSQAQAQCRAQVPNDERSAVAFDLMAAGVPALLRLCYPGVYQVGQADGDWGRPSASSPG